MNSHDHGRIEEDPEGDISLSLVKQTLGEAQEETEEIEPTCTGALGRGGSSSSLTVQTASSPHSQDPRMLELASDFTTALRSWVRQGLLSAWDVADVLMDTDALIHRHPHLLDWNQELLSIASGLLKRIETRLGSLQGPVLTKPGSEKGPVSSWVATGEDTPQSSDERDSAVDLLPPTPSLSSSLPLSPSVLASSPLSPSLNYPNINNSQAESHTRPSEPDTSVDPLKDLKDFLRILLHLCDSSQLPLAMDFTDQLKKGWWAKGKSLDDVLLQVQGTHKKSNYKKTSSFLFWKSRTT